MPLISPFAHGVLETVGLSPEERVKVLTEFNRLCVGRGFTGEDTIVPDPDAIIMLNLAVQTVRSISGS